MTKLWPALAILFAALALPVQAAAADELGAQARIVWSERYASFIACNDGMDDYSQTNRIKSGCKYYGPQPNWTARYYFSYYA